MFSNFFPFLDKGTTLQNDFTLFERVFKPSKQVDG
jgi:hypothetical protein